MTEYTYPTDIPAGGPGAYDEDYHDDWSYEDEPVSTSSVARKRFRWLAISASLAILLVAPVISPALMTHALLVCLVLCMWDAGACLFLLIASIGAYAESLGFFEATPTRIVGAALFLRVLISPGIGGMVRALMKMNKAALFFVAVYMISAMTLGVAGVGHLTPFIYATATLVTFLIAAACVERMDDRREIMQVVLAGLLLVSLYYVPIWVGVLAPTELARRAGQSAAQELMRVGAGRTSLNFNAGLMAALLVGLVYLGTVLPAKGRRLLCLALGGFVFATLVQTGSRAALLCAGGGTLLGAFVAFRLRGLAAVGKVFGPILGGGVFALLFGGLISTRLGIIIDNLFVADLVQRSRGHIWSRALTWVMTHPVPDPNGWLAQTRLVAHNTFLEAGLESGTIGMFALLAATIMALLQAWRSAKAGTEYDRIWHGAVAVVFTTLVVNLNSMSTTGHKLFWALMAVAMMVRPPAQPYLPAEDDGADVLPDSVRDY